MDRSVEKKLISVIGNNTYHYYNHKYLRSLLLWIIMGLIVIIFGIIFYYNFILRSYQKKVITNVQKELIEIDIYKRYIDQTIPERCFGDAFIIAENLYYQCKENNVEVSLALALMKAESGFYKHAVNVNNSSDITLKSYDRGLFQLNSKTYKDYKLQDFFNISKNIELGVKHIKYALDESNYNIVKAIAIYNAGKWTVERGRVKEITLDHINNIVQHKTEIDHLLTMELKKYMVMEDDN